jgi:hypothetical protein
MDNIFETFDATKASEAQRDYCKTKNAPHFAPIDGRCYKCGKNIYVQYDRGDRKSGISVERAGASLITGCPHCSRSYCD